MKQKKNLYFKYGVSLLAALVISLFFSYTIFNDIFASPVKEARLVITATAERNIKSGGSDIRIVRILLDGEEVPFDSIEKQGDWNHADGVWMVVNPDSPATLSYTAENVKELQVDFQMHDGSGVAEVWSNDKRISRIRFVYDTGYFTENAVRIPGHEGEFPNAEEYLTLIRESDAAIPMLIDYFSKIEDPTVIVFFGDHQPMLEESFYETLAGKPLTEWTLAEAQSRYIVPFFIWANYEIDAEENVFTSANFLSELMFEKAGMKLLPYQEFLKSVREEIPAMDGSSWRDADGNWEVLDTSQPILEEYWRLQYRNMFDKKIHY